MTKFLKRIYDLDLINEEDQAPPPPGADDVNDVTPQEAEAAADTEPGVGILSPESEVMYVRLLKKALVIDLDPEDIDNINNLAEVNEENAKQALADILQIIKSYSTEIDIES
jgi:hypothetical protein